MDKEEICCRPFLIFNGVIYGLSSLYSRGGFDFDSFDFDGGDFDVGDFDGFVRDCFDDDSCDGVAFSVGRLGGGFGPFGSGGEFGVGFDFRGIVFSGSSVRTS